MSIHNFSLNKTQAIAKVRLSDNFCEQTDRQLGITGFLRRYDEHQEDVAVIDIGEKAPVRVHVQDFDIIG